jgi:asparagine synthase (glutamine-hydrolysing)
VQSRIENLLVAASRATPQLVTMQTASESARRQLAAERGVQAIYSGQGGDHLLHRRQSPLVAAEYVQRYGLGRNSFPVLLATARMAEQPVLSVFATALRFGLLKPRYDPYAGLRPPPFVFTAKVHEQIHHPWVHSAQPLPAAKCQQIADLVDTQCFSTVSCTYADVVHPLISQPIIECCLRIPTYLLTHGGIERGLARAAFSNDLPSEIIDRTAKGDATAYYHQLILQNLGAIREWLLDGWLVQEQLLNRPSLEAALSENALIDGCAEPYILAAMMAEGWARNAATALAQRRGSSWAQ